LDSGQIKGFALVLKELVFEKNNSFTRAHIREQVEKTLKATNSTIVMEATKELVDELLLDPEGVPTRK
jgi:hypothetical protein